MTAHRLFLLASALAACGVHYATPAAEELGARDARFGYLGGQGPPPEAARACADWSDILGKRDRYARTHVSYPETAPARACFTRVVHQGRAVMVGHLPPGCATPGAAERARMQALAADLERGAVPTLLGCGLSLRQRSTAVEQNARALQDAAARPATYPYDALVVPGYGEPAQSQSSVAGWLPGDACHAPSSADLETFGVMVERTRRAADALAAGVAPLAIVSGGAVHSSTVEAFAMLYLLECVHRVRAEQVLVEPCADHTHTNLRNAARWIVAMGGRTAYLLTDEGMQADYFQEASAFSLIGGSIDQRSLHDWGFVIGSWRQASIGTEAGFWFTPYRFWAEPRDGLGSFTCEGR